MGWFVYLDTYISTLVWKEGIQKVYLKGTIWIWRNNLYIYNVHYACSISPLIALTRSGSRLWLVVSFNISILRFVPFAHYRSIASTCWSEREDRLNRNSSSLDTQEASKAGSREAKLFPPKRRHFRLLSLSVCMACHNAILPAVNRFSAYAEVMWQKLRVALVSLVTNVNESGSTWEGLLPPILSSLRRLPSLLKEVRRCVTLAWKALSFYSSPPWG